MEDKETLRKKYAQLRSGAHAKLRYNEKQQLFTNLRKIPKFSKAKTIMAYMSKGSEVPTKNLILELINDNKKVALPKTMPSEKSIEPHYIQSLEDLEVATFGVLEPKKGCKKALPSQIDVVIVPAVAYDRKGYRLGYGLGFYDIFLAKANLASIGLCYQVQIADALPTEPHDVPVDYVVSEFEVIDAKKK